MRSVALVQAVYYVATGVWPIFHMRSFEWLTGRKREDWLVRTVGVLVTAIGLSVGAGAALGERRTAALLGSLSAAGLAAVDVRYVTKGRIRPVYLADAAAEVAILAAWLALARLRRARPSSTLEE